VETMRLEPELYRLHLDSGRICGEEKTCGKKVKYGSEADAAKVAASLNRSTRIWLHSVPLPCAFCGKWYIGNMMPPEFMRGIIKGCDKHEQV